MRIIPFAVLMALMGSCVSNAQVQTPDQVKGWREDIDFVQRQVDVKHPNPYRRTTQETFRPQLAALSRELPALSFDQTAVGLMQSVAGLRDGHTMLLPGTESGYDTWFPVRFYVLTDGLFITAIDKRFAQFAGAKVLQVGSRSAGEALRAARSIYSSDNDFGANESASLLSSARLLRGLGIIDSLDELRLEVQTGDGTVSRIALPVITTRSSFDWIWWGEMSGPPDADLVTAFGGRTPSQYFDPDRNADLPLHLRGRRAYWFTFLEKPRALYVQLNAMADRSSHTPETFAAFTERLFAFADLHDVDKFLLDIRYNGGGNGRLVNTIVHALIKRDKTINRTGHLYTLVGRKTFSAGIGLLIALREHTNTLLVGEPAGAALNAAGDPDMVVLPRTRFRMSVSTNYFVGTKFTDQSREIPIHIPAQFSSADYFGGRDPAVDAALSSDAVALLDLVASGGTDVAKRLYERRKALFGSLRWWEPFDRVRMNDAGLRLLAGGRTDEAIAALSMNVDRFPDNWETWDSLAEALMAARQYPRAIEAYQRALAISPDNWNATAQKKAIERMKK